MHAVIGDVTVLHALRHRIRHYDSKENLHALITLRTLFPVLLSFSLCYFTEKIETIFAVLAMHVGRSPKLFPCLHQTMQTRKNSLCF